MTITFLYRGYGGEVTFPPDDFNETTAMKIVKKSIDSTVKSFTENKQVLPKELFGEEGQVSWKADYLHGREVENRG